MGSLVIDDCPLMILPKLACQIGLNEAIVLQQIHYWTEKNKKYERNFRDGFYWVYNSYPEWKNQFPWWSETTIKRTFISLENKNLIRSARYNKMGADRTKWYRVDYDVMFSSLDVSKETLPSGQIGTMEETKLTPPIPETTTEINNNGKKVKNGSLEKNFVSVKKEYKRDIIRFINWYREELYPAYYNKKHSPLKADQMQNIHDTLDSFIIDFCIDDISAVCEMARSFMERVKSKDHNINHFISGNMLEIRYYDCGLL